MSDRVMTALEVLQNNYCLVDYTKNGKLLHD